MRRLSAPLLALTLAGCSRSCGARGGVDALGGDAAASGDAGPPALVCEPHGAPFALGVDAADVGDVVVRERSLLVSLARSAGDGGARAATIVDVPLDGSATRDTVLGPLMGDDPPATLRARGVHVVSARIARGLGRTGSASARQIVVESLEPRRAELAKIDEAADESRSMDVALAEDGTGLLAWDEDDATGRRGLVKVARFPAPDGGRIGAIVVSSAGANGEAPRVSAMEGGYVVAYRAEAPIAEDGGASLEGAGEPRRHRWVEVSTLAPDGGVAAAARVAGTRAAHVATFELVVRGAATTLVVHDEEQMAGEGAGGRIVAWAGVHAEPLVAGGVGAAPSPVMVGGFLSWVGDDDATYVALADGGAAAPVERDAGARVRMVAAAEGELFAVAEDASRGGARIHRYRCR